MKKISSLLPLLLLFTGCVDHDDFSITGTVVDYEMCNGVTELGYAIAVSSPDSIGEDYTARDGDTYHNVVVCYGADRQLHPNDNIKGKIYWDNKYSRSHCSYHIDREAPEAVFTDLKKI